MDPRQLFLESLKAYGVGRRKLDDELFAGDKPPPRLGIYDEDDECLCHEVIKSQCNVPGCKFTADSLMDFENHYNTSHRYACCQCKKVLPSPHLLDLHVQEKHDSFFAVLAAKKPSYCCYIEECKDKFKTADERLNHCVQIHKLPKDFRFDLKPKNPKQKKKTAAKSEDKMELDRGTNEFTFSNNKQKAFSKYKGKKFTTDYKEKDNTRDVNMDTAMEDLKQSLPK